ncbi:hypothetical protein IC582_015450 [Cucumis melo]|uniref:Uncharacterized protein LOC103493608 n=2 Tax=Cucumis melo TaxID=3656 RepID=A0A1S3BUA6_CUCME|nr:uncharacterized protein LOC103493608 [Cucumis melo]KAA0064450.1 uncharacterized protein E6C27_scaffold255G001630 [Cucumis melo var. makuwa]TYK20139.1 uncharacterized protein E5676_scaffold134G002650 [Cucumis melo var. makuwa]
MIKTLPPFPSTDKTAEIMSRYRPIAPKPESPFPTSDHSLNNIPHSSSSSSSSSSFLRNVWPQLQARPTRTRKRSRPPPISPHSLKRARITPPPNFSLHHPFPSSLLPHLSLPSINSGFHDSSSNSNLVTLPLLPSVSDETETTPVSEINFIKSFDEEKGVEFNVDSAVVSEIPQEKDLLQQLQCPVSVSNVITPHPVRPVGSSIRVGCINEAQNPVHSNNTPQLPKKPDEVEKEVESEVLPAVISDSNNRVRMANSAYKEMVGQPECLWLDSMVTGDERLKGRRIGGEVMLHLSDAAAVPHSSNGFSCWVRIEWGNSDGKKNSVTAFCDVIKLSCVSRDYLFTWRFHTQTKNNHNNNNNASNPICINV